MLKQGDMVAFRTNPQVPIGKVEVCHGGASVGHVLSGGLSITTFFLSNGRADCDERPHRDDVVLYEAVTEPTHYIIIQVLNGHNRYDSIQPAQKRVDELLAENSNRQYVIYKAVEERTGELKVNSKKLG